MSAYSTFTTLLSTVIDFESPNSLQTTVTALGLVYSATYGARDYTYNATSYSVFSEVRPLTTTFSPKPDCTLPWHAYSWDAEAVTYSTYPTFQLPAVERTDCFPSDYFIVTYYSPGICPSGYTLANRDIVEETTSNTVVSKS